MLRRLPVALLASAFLSTACGTGVIYFEKRGDGPPAGPAKDFKAFDLECQDTFAATGGQTALGNAAGHYSISCTHQGQPMPRWTELGVFHAAPMARNHWDQYRSEVIAKAQAQGCPAVAVRTSPPTQNQQGEAIGAFCIQP